MRIAFAFTALVALAPVTAAPIEEDKDAAKAEMTKLNGAWKVTSMILLGKELDSAENGDVVIFKDGDYKWEKGLGLPGKITSIDPTKKPKEIDYEMTDGTKTKAIYKLEGDTFTDCFVLGGGDRPTEFKSTEDNKVMVITYKKVKIKD